MTESNRFIPLCVVTGAHGIKGAVKVKPFTADPKSMLNLLLHDKDGTTVPFKCIGEAKGQLILQLDGIRYRDEAEKKRGLELGVMRSALPETAPDEFYIEDLIGMTALLEDGSQYGTIKAVYNFGAGDILEITTASGDELLSYTKITVPHMDEQARTLTVCLPEIVSGQES